MNRGAVRGWKTRTSAKRVDSADGEVIGRRTQRLRFSCHRAAEGGGQLPRTIMGAPVSRRGDGHCRTFEARLVRGSSVLATAAPVWAAHT